MKIIIDASDGDIAVRDYLRVKLGFSGSIVKALKKDENGIVLNGERVTVRARLKEGDELLLACDRELSGESSVIAHKGNCDIVYEDEAIIVFRKPSGMPTHPSRNHLLDTLANAAAYIFEERGVPFVFRAVTRLDNDVSGIVLCAANKLCANRLSNAIAAQEIEKRYFALCDGAPLKKGECGTVEGYIKRTANSIITREMNFDGDGAYSVTRYEVLAENGKKTLLSLSPVTGRTHQLRLAAKSLGCSICGDGFYGNEETAPRCMLHAYELRFSHPLTNETTVLTAPLYPDMEKLIKENFGEIEYGR